MDPVDLDREPENLSQGGGEVPEVRWCVEAHQVGTEQPPEQAISFGEGTEELLGRKRDMKEEPDSSVGQPLPQQLGKEEELVIVNPDEIAFPIMFGHDIGEPLIGLDVRLPISHVERELIQ
jgi:hypothetical protein